MEKIDKMFKTVPSKMEDCGKESLPKLEWNANG